MVIRKHVQPEKSVGIDLGTGNAGVTVQDGSHRIHVSFAESGKVIATQVYAKDDGVMLIGSKARHAALKDPSKLYKTYKRLFPGAPDQPFNGGPTPAELTLGFLQALWKHVVDTNPDLRAYVDGTKDRDKLVISVTCPATYRTEAQQRLVAIGEQVGDGFRVDQLIPEPVAAVQNFRESMTQGFQQADKVIVVDVGSGTTDLTVLEFNQGKFDQLIGGKGDAFLGGNDFTGRIFVHLAQQHLPVAVDCFQTDTGFSVANVTLDPAQRRDAMTLWDASEGMKQRLTTEEVVEEFVTLAGALLEMMISRHEAQGLFVGGESNLYERVEAAVRDVLDGSDITFDEVKYVLLVGGAAQTVGLAEFVAAGANRKVNEIHVSSDSTNAISDGAAFQALHQEEVSRVLPGGLAVQVKDAAGNRKSKFFLPTGETVPASGKVVEKMGQFVRSNGGQAVLQLVLNEAKPGVRVDVPDGKTVIVDEEQVVTIKQIRQTIDLPAGEHATQLGVIVDPNGKVFATVEFPGLPHQEVIRVAVTDDRGNEESLEAAPAKRYNVVICLDCSGSMYGDMDEAKTAVYDVLELLADLDVRVGIVQFGADTLLKVPLTDDFQRIADGVADLEADGGTPMKEALEIAQEHIQIHQDDGREVLAILVSDGAPAERGKTENAALQLKQFAKLATIAIGDAADQQFLLRIASSLTYFSTAKDIRGLFGAMEQILDLFLGDDSDADVDGLGVRDAA